MPVTILHVGSVLNHDLIQEPMSNSVSPVAAPVSRGQSRQQLRGSLAEPVEPRLEHFGKLLVYLADYGILICKLCKFAIQPKAITGHLLRHHIYRENRRRLLGRVAELTLSEPDDVSVPSSRGTPVPYLPVTTGYRCSLPHCGHLCISEKRMSSHMRQQRKALMADTTSGCTCRPSSGATKSVTLRSTLVCLERQIKKVRNRFTPEAHLNPLLAYQYCLFVCHRVQVPYPEFAPAILWIRLGERAHD